MFDYLIVGAGFSGAVVASQMARNFDRKVLLVDHQENPHLWLAARNLSDVQLLANLQVTPYHILNARHVVFTKAAIQALQEVLTK